MWGSQSFEEQYQTFSTDTGDGANPGTLYVVSAPSGVYVGLVKPTLDRLFATALLLIVLPVMILCAIAVMISVGTPVFFTQERVGRNGRRFRVYKFRTMHQDRRQRNEPMSEQLTMEFGGDDRRKTHKSPVDPRLTGVGRFLRKWSLDELPQLLNVVRGDMSMIGPRPELPDIVARYGEWEHSRHMVKPGLTGLWQVSARGQGRPMHEHVGVDIEYVAGLSASLDFQIFVRTPISLLTNRGF